jgi:hypothetical protein
MLRWVSPTKPTEIYRSIPVLSTERTSQAGGPKAQPGTLCGIALLPAHSLLLAPEEAAKKVPRADELAL